MRQKPEEENVCQVTDFLPVPPRAGITTQSPTLPLPWKGGGGGGGGCTRVRCGWISTTYYPSKTGSYFKSRVVLHPSDIPF